MAIKKTSLKKVKIIMQLLFVCLTFRFQQNTSIFRSLLGIGEDVTSIIIYIYHYPTTSWTYNLSPNRIKEGHDHFECHLMIS
jgi:hypothetical protein